MLRAGVWGGGVGRKEGPGGEQEHGGGIHLCSQCSRISPACSGMFLCMGTGGWVMG